MLGDISGLEKIYIVCGYTDMRKSIDGFAPLSKTSLRWIRHPVLSSFLWKKTGQDQSLVPRTGWLCSDL